MKIDAVWCPVNNIGLTPHMKCLVFVELSKLSLCPFVIVCSIVLLCGFILDCMCTPANEQGEWHIFGKSLEEQY